jgi:hypothetical protein
MERKYARTGKGEKPLLWLRYHWVDKARIMLQQGKDWNKVSGFGNM